MYDGCYLDRLSKGFKAMKKTGVNWERGSSGGWRRGAQQEWRKQRERETEREKLYNISQLIDFTNIPSHLSSWITRCVMHHSW